ncbi:hypothetical protein B5V01_27450 [Mesorhizobium erdmanii]|uniref:Integrase catalytic domain-containing protein n=2 Tax=Mesorhizobium TaxID=68287 RepID=A0A3M9WZA7_9HYPH|nr:hypothetical protein DNR46_35270 [Mesorhizobium japonicum]RXT38050.1 hypothetical protein B5V01_27450 [Mesorhizobium erdmanii]
MVTPDPKWKAVIHACEVHGMSQRRACQAPRIDRSTMRYTSIRAEDAPLREAIKATAAERRRFGYRRIHVVLDRAGHRDEPEAAAAPLLGGEAGGAPSRSKRALGTRRPMLVSHRADARWSLDFVSDTFADGRRFRVLAVVEDYTRECLALVADTSLSGLRIARELDAIIRWHGRSDTIVSDYGTDVQVSGNRGSAIHRQARRRHHCENRFGPHHRLYVGLRRPSPPEVYRHWPDPPSN